MPERFSRAHRRGVVVALVVLAYAAFAALKLIVAHGDVTVFVVAGDFFVDPARLEAPLRVLPHSYGYDGQFAYRLALDPFTGRVTDHGIRLDTPALRAQRIGYPLLAHLLSFGSARLVAASLVLVNLAAAALLAWASTGIALLYRRPPWQGLVIALYPGLLLALSRDTAELASTALAVTAAWLALRGRPWRAGLVACAAALTRETTLLYLFGFGAVAGWRMIANRRPDASVGAFLLPVLTLVIWQAVLIATWGSTSFAEVGGNDLGGPPFGHFIAAVAGDFHRLGAGNSLLPIHALLTRLFLITAASIVLLCLRRTVAIDWRLALPWLCYLALASLLTDAVWVVPDGYLRILVDLYVTGCLVVLASPGDRLVRVLAGLVVPFWALEFAFA